MAGVSVGGIGESIGALVNREREPMGLAAEVETGAAMFECNPGVVPVFG